MSIISLVSSIFKINADQTLLCHIIMCCGMIVTSSPGPTQLFSVQDWKAGWGPGDEARKIVCDTTGGVDQSAPIHLMFSMLHSPFHLQQCLNRRSTCSCILCYRKRTQTSTNYGHWPAEHISWMQLGEHQLLERWWISCIYMTHFVWSYIFTGTCPMGRYSLDTRTVSHVLSLLCRVA